MKDIFCPQCGNSVVKSYGEKCKIRTRILIMEGKRTIAKCVSCGAEIEVPVRLHEDELLSYASIRHYVLK